MREKEDLGMYGIISPSPDLGVCVFAAFSSTSVLRPVM